MCIYHTCCTHHASNYKICAIVRFFLFWNESTLVIPFLFLKHSFDIVCAELEFVLHSIPMVSTCLKIPDTIFLTLPATISIAPLCTISLWTSVHCAPNNTIKHMQYHSIHYVYNGSIGVSMSSYNYGKNIFLICAFVLQNLFLHFTNQVRKKPTGIC